MAEDHDEYHEQTEEDLENVPPMSRMQKIILVLALVGFVIAIVYIVAYYMGVL